MKDAVVINQPVQRVVCTGCGAEATLHAIAAYLTCPEGTDSRKLSKLVLRNQHVPDRLSSILSDAPAVSQTASINRRTARASQSI
jgi:hypothetical protein